MQAETPSDNPAADAATPVVGNGPKTEGVGASTAAADALDLVDEALEALESDDLERAEELAERFEGPNDPDAG